MNTEVGNMDNKDFNGQDYDKQELVVILIILLTMSVVVLSIVTAAPY